MNQDLLLEEFEKYIIQKHDTPYHSVHGGTGMGERLSNWWSGKASSCFEVCFGETMSMTDYANGNTYTTYDCE
jgi:hypothetical protein